MNSNAAYESKPRPRRRFRFRFSLLALILFVTLVCILLAWWMQPSRVVATAMFRVSRVPPTMLVDGPRQHDVAEFEVVKKSQIAALHSDFVLLVAARKPGITSLSIFAGCSDPVEWLKDNIVVEFPEDGEYLSISLEGVEAHSGDLKLLVDAVAKAYSDEVLFNEKQQQLGERDLLARTRDDLHREIQDKWEVYLDIAREAGYDVRPSGHRCDLRVKVIGQIDRELIRLEGEKLRDETSNESENDNLYEQRIAKLRDERAKMEDAVRKVEEDPAKLKVRMDELEGLERTASELARKLRGLDIESNAPPRITQVQQAIVSPAD